MSLQRAGVVACDEQPRACDHPWLLRPRVGQWRSRFPLRSMLTAASIEVLQIKAYDLAPARRAPMSEQEEERNIARRLGVIAALLEYAKGQTHEASRSGH